VSITTLLLQFTATALVIVACGVVLARTGDTIADRTKLSGVWVGSVLLALVTSLPEIVTDVAAVRLGVVDLAVGDLLGSSMANMLLLGIVALSPGGRALFSGASRTHSLNAALGILLTIIAAATLIVRPSARLFGIGAGSLLIVVVYLLVSGVAYRINQDRPLPESHRDLVGAMSMSRAVTWLLVSTVAIVLVAPRFAHIAHRLAEQSGLGATVVGTLLVGLSTSLPELVTSLAAVRLKAYDLAIGNLFGSNAVNMLVFAPLDALHPPGALLSVAESSHVLTALVAVALMAVGVVLTVLGPQRPVAVSRGGGAAMLLLYAAGVWLLTR
jgi:cation:H+ antiporter